MAEIESALLVRMEASLAKFEKQMDKARKAAGGTATDVEKRFDQMNNRIAANANKAAQGLTKIGSSAGASRFVLQNTANQLGDIAVQISSGTSASRALSQQLPQMLGGFGALGGALGVVGPLLGTIAAIGIPVAIALASMGDGAKTAEEAMKGLEKAISDLGKAQKLDGMTFGELVDQYGGLAGKAREIFEINRQIASLRANSAMSDVTRGFAGELGVEGVLGFGPAEIREMETTIAGLEEELARLSRASELTDKQMAEAFARIPQIRESLGGLKAARGEFEDLADKLGITKDEAREFAALLADAGQAQGPKAAADAMSELLIYLESVIGRQKEATADGLSLRDAIAAAATRFLELAKIDAAGPIERAADAAARLADNLARARGARVDAAVGGNVDFFDPRNEAGLSGVILRDRPVPAKNRPGYTPPKSGGGGSKAPDGLKEAERLYESTRTAAEKYAAELERINELHRLFPEIVDNEVRDRAVTALNESAGRLSETARAVESSLENMFASIVTGAASGKEAVASLLQELSRLLIHEAFKSLGIGDLLGGLFPKRIGGGMVSAGSPYMVGEAGPEPFFPKTDGRILSVAQAQAALRGGSGGSGGGAVFTFAPVVDARGADAAAVARLEAGLATLHSSFERRVHKTLRAGRNSRMNRQWEN